MPRVSLPYTGIDQLSDLEVKIGTKIILVALSRDRAESMSRDITKAFVAAGKLSTAIIFVLDLPVPASSYVTFLFLQTFIELKWYSA